MKRTLAFFFAVLMVFLSACGKEGPKTETVPSTVPSTEAPLNDVVIYREGEVFVPVVRADIATDEIKSAVVSVRKALASVSGGESTMMTDWVEKNETIPDVPEILIGETNRPESTKALEKISEGEGILTVIGSKLILTAYDEFTLQALVEYFITEYLSGDFKELSYSMIPEYKFVPKSKAYYVGDNFTFKRSDERYGGAQYICKLFTEGYGRGPEPEEYKEYADYIFEHLCKQETLADLAKTHFSSEKFATLGLDDRQTAFAIYRAVLNRDPKQTELEGFSAGDCGKTAYDLAMSTEFKHSVHDINLGSYGWGKNNADQFTGTEVFTSAQITEMLRTERVVTLPQGSLVLCTSQINIPAGKTIQTEGNPTNYLQMARFLRCGKGFMLVDLADNSRLLNVFLDGYRSKYGFDGGANGRVCGSNARVEGCKMCDTADSTNMSTVAIFRGVYLGNNLVTCYTSDNEAHWTDGFTHQARGTIENNTIIDATDVAIVLFREWTGDPQDSVVRNNTIISAGNSCFGGIHTDAWMDEQTFSFVGCKVYDNRLWTSMKTHFNILLSCASTAWHVNGNLAKGASFCNNYTPEGLSAVCGVAIGSDSMDDVVMHGNQLHVYIANVENGTFGTHLVIFNDKKFSGSVQGPYYSGALHNATTSYIGQRINVVSDSWTYREGIVYEDKVQIK